MVCVWSNTIYTNGFIRCPPEWGVKNYVGQSFRRFVPSGGALYPNELYVYMKLSEIPEGIYHFSAAHHSLVLLQEGNYDSYLSRSLGSNVDISGCFATVFVSTVFWKNFYKYHNFSYRLQGLDAGVVLGQALEAAERMGITTRVCYQFLDRPLHHLLGVSEQNESVYAVIPMSTQPEICMYDNDVSISSDSLCEELPKLEPAVYQRSKKIIDYPMLKKVNEAALFESPNSFVKLKKGNTGILPRNMETIFLPFTEPLKYDFASVCRERHSPDLDFRLGKITLNEVSILLKEVFSFSYHHDLTDADADGKIEQRVTFLWVFFACKRKSDVSYAYEKNAHALRRKSSGDYREYLPVWINNG